MMGTDGHCYVGNSIAIRFSFNTMTVVEIGYIQGYIHSVTVIDGPILISQLAWCVSLRIFHRDMYRYMSPCFVRAMGFMGSIVRAGVLMHTPYKLAGIHLQGGGSGARNYNYAVSVKHPLFVKSYVEYVLPELTNMPTSIFAFAPDALSTVHEYLDTQKDCIARNGLVHLVAKFKAAHPLQ